METESSERVVAPYGTWSSPITADVVATAGRGLDSPWLADDVAWWLESRPAEAGRVVLMQARPGSSAEDVTPEGFNVRTMVHEYGGGAYYVHGGTVFFTNFEDQRLYRLDPGSEPEPITPGVPGRRHRYADGRVTADGGLWIGVRERHEGDHPTDVVNELVAVATDGSAEPRIIAGGRDFYAAPRISPDGTKLAFLAWDLPWMPWDGCELFAASLQEDGSLGRLMHVAGRDGEESIWQPEWSRTTFAVLDPESGGLSDLDLPHDAMRGPGVAAEGSSALVVAGSATLPVEVVRVDTGTGSFEVLRSGTETDVDTAGFSIPEAIEFPTEGGLTAHALYYPPASAAFEGADDDLPPLIVMSHGGPTAHATPIFSLQKQFWTSRGFAVVDVNYGGSTGYGRAYRERLNGKWGVVDLADCVNAARHLVTRGEADPERLLVTGGSAGGYTTICALTFTDDFAAGTSYFGLADLEPFAAGETHKFESRYEHTLVGPYPEAADLYRERSPIHFADRISTPMLVLQGADDEVVPKSQAEAIVAALQERRIPHAYILFEGEGHGFRKAENIVRSLEAELSFYLQVLGLEPGDPLPKLEIELLSA